MQLIHGDCLEKMKDIPGKSIDMILCDLPYGTTACKWDVVIPFEPLWEQYKRIIKDCGAIVLFGSEPFSSYLRMSNIKQYKYDWIWKKAKPTGFSHSKNMPLKDYECISVFSNGAIGHYGLVKNRMFYTPQGVFPLKRNISRNKKGFEGTMERSSQVNTYVGELSGFPKMVIEFSNVLIGTVHPTQKPVALLEYLIKTYTLEGETVLDNCMGSGSTGIACINTKRNFIGIEKDDRYFEIAKKRIEEHLTTAHPNSHKQTKE